MSTSERGLRRSSVILTCGVTVAALGPLLVGRGIALRGDMVFVPDQPWKAAWLGLNGAVPRAVPMDAIVSVLDEVLPGAVIQRLVLVAAFILGGLGIARVCRAFSGLGQAAAIVTYLWNPWVLERLSIGQWPMVLGYGLLPWLVLAVLRLREDRPGGWSGTAFFLVLCAVCAPSMGLIAVAVALLILLAGGGPARVARVARVGGLGVVANLPWLLPALLGPSLTADPDQFEAFAARGESPLGTAASLLSMGGIWKSSIVPPERTHVLVVLVTLVVSLSFLGALPRARARLGRTTVIGLGAVGGVFVMVAFLPTLAPLGRGLGALSTHVAALGILRDSQRYLAPLGLVLAVGAAALVDWLAERGRTGNPGFGALAVLIPLLPVLLLPSLLWGLVGGLRPVSYPDDWDRVAAITDPANRGTGAVVVLPWRGNYRGFGWNDRRAVLDPAERYLAGDVLVDDRLFLSEEVVGSEDALLARVGGALEAPDAAAGLRELGVRWVLIEKENGVADDAVPVGMVAFDGTSLRLVDLGEPTGAVSDYRQVRLAWLVVSVDALVLGILCVSFWQLWCRIMRNKNKGE